MLFAFIAKTSRSTEGLLPPDPRVDRLARLLPLPRGILLGSSAAAVGGVMLIAAVNDWRVHDFGRLNYADTMRVVVPGVTLAVLGYQTILSCLFLEPPEHAAAVMKAAFDEYAGRYDSALNEGLSLSGESKEYFAGGARALARWPSAGA